MPVFLFTDIEGSTQLWELHGHVMADALVRHDAILSSTVESHGGRVVKHTGDGVFAVFEKGTPLECALEIQHRLQSADWGPIGILRSRIALHMGEAEQRDDDYFGSSVNRTARLLTAAWGGQTLLTEQIIAAFDAPSGATLQDYGVHMLKDLGYPQRIYGLVSAAAAENQFPPLRSLSTRSHNLPPQPTPFVGRRQELADIAERLQQPACRLLTIVGSGGMGKTRLSLQVAAEVIETFAHGVFQVPLAPLSSPDYIYTTIAASLHFPFTGSESHAQQLFDYVREKEILLILDNFEHLIAGAGLVSDLLQNAPRLKVIATSRERLNLQEEWTYEIRGLPYPQTANGHPLEQYGAVQLFLQNANRVYPDFKLDDREKQHVADIVRLVEGIPLGIELAASWVRVLSCQEIAREIENSRDFLSSTASNTPSRHHSLRAVFENSWWLLPGPERHALARLSVFRGGFLREAAREVAQADIRLLLSLSDKSLLRRGTEGRYEMLETIRQFAAEKLEADATTARNTTELHARFYLALLQRHRDDLKEAAQKEALRLLEPEVENIRVAWRHALNLRLFAQLQDAQDGLYHLYELRGWFQEGMAEFGKAIDLLGKAEAEVAAPQLTAMLLSRRGWFSYRLGQFEAATRDLSHCLDIARQHGFNEEIAFALYNLGVINYQLGHYGRAIEDLENSLKIWRATGGRHEVARTLSILGIIYRERGATGRAEKYLSESLALHRTTGDRRGISRCLNLLGLIKRDRQQTKVAVELLEESLAICREIDDQRDAAYACSILGAILYEAGEYDRAREYCQESLEIRERIGERRGMAFSLHDLGNISRALDKPNAAWSYLRRALSLAVDTKAIPLVHYVITGIAELAASTGEVGRALELLYFVANQRSSFEMATTRALALIEELQEQVSAADRSEIKLVAQNRQLDDIVEELLDHAP